MFFKLKEFKEVLRVDGVFVLKSVIEYFIECLGDGSGYIEDFCVLVRMDEIKLLIRCDVMLNFYWDLE